MLRHLRHLTSRPMSLSSRAPPLYTRTGDKGTTSLLNSERRAKDDPVFEALGSLDDLSANLGHARELLLEQGEGSIPPQLEEVQMRLLDLGSHLAAPLDSERTKEDLRERLRVDPAHTAALEDEISDSLEPLRSFILPSGGKAGSYLHVARCACRRAERRVVPVVRAGGADPEVGKYINRLSDYLFAAARRAAHHAGAEVRAYKMASKK